MQNSEKHNSRAIAVHIIERWLSTGVFPGRMLESVENDHAFVMELVNGILRHRRLLSWIADQFVRRQPEPIVQAALWVGLYQLFCMSSIAEYAAVNETVAAVRQLGATSASGFVNAVLRRAIRERESLLGKLELQPWPMRVSHPDILLRRWIANFGQPAAEQICEWNNRRAVVSVCANRQKISDTDLEKNLQQAGALEGKLFSAGRLFFFLKRGVAIRDLPGYHHGLFLAADPATANAVELLAVRPGMRVLDACAAPGGKTAMIAADMDGEGELQAWEPYMRRRARLVENMKRLSLADSVRILPGNALRPNPDAGLFDRILLDVPCSNTGVIRRKPDVRWNFSLKRLDELVALQMGLLAGAAGLLAPAGRIVYSTCSMEPEENEDLLHRWLADQPGLKLLEERRSRASEAGTDGFYAVAACLRADSRRQASGRRGFSRI